MLNKMSCDHGSPMVAASVHGALAALTEALGTSLAGKRILVYSYGSGMAGTLYCMRGRHLTSGGHNLATVAAQVPELLEYWLPK